jgi:putative sterol carrier protein
MLKCRREVEEMSAMADEAIKEVAATRERYRGTRLTSGEFFYLAERIDRLDEKMTAKIDSGNNALDAKLQSLDAKLTGEIRALDAKLTGKIESEVKNLSDKFTTTQHWMIGLFVAAVGVIVAILLHH